MSSALHATLGQGTNLYCNKEKTDRLHMMVNLSIIDRLHSISSFIFNYINSVANQNKSKIKTKGYLSYYTALEVIFEIFLFIEKSRSVLKRVIF